MSAVNGSSGSHHLEVLDTLTGVTGSDVVLIAGWFKRDATASLGSVQGVLDLSAAGASPSLGLHYNSAPVYLHSSNATQAGGTSAPSTSAFQHVAVLYGPWSGSSQPRGLWINGVSEFSSSVSQTSSTATLSRFRIFVRGGGTGRAYGKVADVGIWVNPGSASGIVADLQTYSPVALSPTHAWRLLTDGTASVGGSNLAAVGTITYDSGDHPSLLTDLPASSLIGDRPYVVIW